MTTLQEKINDVLQEEQDFYDSIDHEMTFALRTTTGKDAVLDLRRLSMMHEIRCRAEEINVYQMQDGWESIEQPNTDTTEYVKYWMRLPKLPRRMVEHEEND